MFKLTPALLLVLASSFCIAHGAALNNCTIQFDINPNLTSLNFSLIVVNVSGVTFGESQTPIPVFTDVPLNGSLFLHSLNEQSCKNTSIETVTSLLRNGSAQHNPALNTHNTTISTVNENGKEKPLMFPHYLNSTVLLPILNRTANVSATNLTLEVATAPVQFAEETFAEGSASGPRVPGGTITAEPIFTVNSGLVNLTLPPPLPRNPTLNFTAAPENSTQFIAEAEVFPVNKTTAMEIQYLRFIVPVHTDGIDALLLVTGTLVADATYAFDNSTANATYTTLNARRLRFIV